MQILLSSPEITCDHCIDTISEVVGTSGLGIFVSGDPEARTFVVDLNSGAALDALASALAGAGYPLGPVPAARGDTHQAPADDWRPRSFRVEKTDVGANVNYDCYCGCDAGFALDRAQADQPPESCCCGNQILVGVAAGSRLTASLEEAARYRIDVQAITMPWGQPLDVALAIPRGA